MEVLIIPVVIAVLVIVAIFALGGIVIISERQVGIVVKRYSPKALPADRLIALNGEAGYQAQTLGPGVHFGFWPWFYSVRRVPVTVIPSGEIALVVAADGTSIPPERILGKTVDCDNYQDAYKFLTNGGEKGRQLGILTAGAYRINTALFTVITRQNANQNGMHPDDLLVYEVDSDMVGIITTMDGAPIDEGEIAGLYIPNHDNFQNAQAFIHSGGRRGLQEQVLLSGSWNLNPWFVQVEQVPMTEIPIGKVGVVISYVGKAHIDVSGTDFKHGDLVNVGHKGVWVSPLYPGKHAINTRVMKVELVPTTNIVLNWSQRSETHQYDSSLSSITVNSKDGFTFDLEVSQIIHVGALEAPKVISRIGSVQNMVDHVLHPIVSNYFRNAAQAYTVLDFLHARSERQTEAMQHVGKAIRAYDVEAIDTLLGKIVPPPALMQTLTDRKIAEEQNKTFQVQQEAQTQRQQLVRATSLADIQQEMVKSEQGVSIAELQARSKVKEAEGEAEAIRLKAQGEAEAIRAKGDAQASAYQAGAVAMGEQGFTAVQLMQIIGDQKVRIIPEIAVNGGAGGGAGGSGVIDALLGIMLRNEVRQMNNNGNTNGNSNGSANITVKKEE